VSCAIYDGGPDRLCGWCREPAEAHEWHWCPSCRGDRVIPDLTDRVSQRRCLPVWAWRHVPCGCTFEGGYKARRGGVVTRDGIPVEDVELDAVGVG